MLCELGLVYNKQNPFSVYFFVIPAYCVPYHHWGRQNLVSRKNEMVRKTEIFPNITTINGIVSDSG